MAGDRGWRGFALRQLLWALAGIVVLALVVPLVAAILVNRSRVQRATAQTDRIARAVRSFSQDSGFPPAWRRAPAGAPGVEADRLDLLVGTGEAAKVSGDGAWADGRLDTLENQLRWNGPGYARASTDDTTGWRGPYLDTDVPPDPWQNRYVVNIGASIQTGDGAPPAVWALSAGPNGVIETPAAQPRDRAVLGGDDVGTRIW